jgi:hypothetical protein
MILLLEAPLPSKGSEMFWLELLLERIHVDWVEQWQCWHFCVLYSPAAIVRLLCCDNESLFG